LQSLLVSIMGQKMTYYFRQKIARKLNNLPLSYFEKKNHGDILSLITNDIDTFNQGLIQSVPQLVTTVTSVIGIIIMMFSINVLMTFISLLIIPISICLMIFIVKKSQNYFVNHQLFLAEVNSDVEEMFSFHNVVKAFNAEEKMLKKFNTDNNKLSNMAWKSNFISSLMHPIMVFLGNLGYVIIAIVGTIFCIKNKITVGNIQSFITYTRNLTHPIGQFSQILNMIQSSLAASSRIFAFLDELEEVKVVDVIKQKEEIKGNVEFKNVQFGYNEKIIIKDFSLKIEAGKKVAIVGPTGAGKTTLVKLLMRFYEINKGQILIDGHNIINFKRPELRSLFGMVLQDTWMFNGTIMENLRFGNLLATDEEVIEAAKKAHVHHFIQTLPEAYNMEINEDVSNISEGQKQLLTIARAILANPKILILDEATSSVDTRTEILIQKAMDELMKNRTSFIIAHRLSTIQNADLILVLDQGDIKEYGTHEELLAAKGFYYNLYNSQFE